MEGFWCCVMLFMLLVFVGFIKGLQVFLNWIFPPCGGKCP